MEPVVGGSAHHFATLLIDEFRTLPDVLVAESESIKRATGDDQRLDQFFETIHTVFKRALMGDVTKKPLIPDVQALLQYLHVDMGFAQTEQFKVLFLNSTNHLIREAVIAKGSIATTPFYPRDVIKRALELGATALILVHNHPSGNTKPSKADIQNTKKMIDAAACFDIVVHDHFIVSRSDWSGVRSAMNLN